MASLRTANVPLSPDRSPRTLAVGRLEGVVLVLGRRMTAVVVLAASGMLAACSEEVDAEPVAAAPTPTTEARAVLSAMGGSGATGVVRFGHADGEAVEIRVELTGAPPGANEISLLPGENCSSDETPTGGHALTTVAVGPDGRASTVLSSPELTLEPRVEGTVRGRQVVVLADQAPVACGMVVPIGRWSES